MSNDGNNDDSGLPWIVEAIRGPVKLAAWDRLTDKYMLFVQTTAAVLGLVGAGVAIGRASAPLRKEVSIWRRMRREVSLDHLVFPRHIRINTCPYRYPLPHRRALILQGPARSGTTSLLFKQIPFFRALSFNPFRWDCHYLDGKHAKNRNSFEDWLTGELFGSTSNVQTELERGISLYRMQQPIRTMLEKLGLPIGPKPLFILVDHFETPLRQFPDKALAWADSLTNLHVHKNLARVIFVVRSSKAVASLQNLSGENRFSLLTIDSPPESAVPDRCFLDFRYWYNNKSFSYLVPYDSGMRQSIEENRALYQQCENNVGIYQAVQVAVALGEVAKEDIHSYIEQMRSHFERHDNLPLPFCRHVSWATVPVPIVRHELRCGVIRVLVQTGGSIDRNRDDIEAILSVLDIAIERLNIVMLTEMSMHAWVELLTNDFDSSRGLTRVQATSAALGIFFTLGHPCPAANVSNILSPDPLKELSEKGTDRQD
ncbi:expressed unknown protein [Seminavis robusta]|uniref:Uncharacterized protein n=1 Tax=Seminavis robusta TaxID=568900 RepID=A0A9N8DEC9_9STRA|nr:expressed unknown protein [Seminavis robusta]|eukprot:Sro49_g028840.1 n/a (485) ;mRNA; f:131602-133056